MKFRLPATSLGDTWNVFNTSPSTTPTGLALVDSTGAAGSARFPHAA